MKKMIKLSLVAALAAGLTTTASAKSLEEAIKGVDVSGSVSYTMEKLGDDTTEAQHDIDLRLNLKSKVNDKITANIRFDEKSDDDIDDAQNSSSPGLDIDRAYFTYKNDGLTSSFGLISTPLTDGGQADGINFSKKMGGLSLGGGYLYNTSTANTQDVAYVTVGGAAGAAGYSVAYASVMESDADAASNSGTFLHANVNAKAGAAKVNFDYSSAAGDLQAADQTQMKLSANIMAGAISIDAAYAVNGADGGSTLVDGSDVAASNISMGETDLSSAAADGASAIYLAASTKVADGKVTVAYATISSDTATEEETTMKVNYTTKMSKNFKLFVNYEDYDLSTKESEITLGAKYSF